MPSGTETVTLPQHESFDLFGGFNPNTSLQPIRKSEIPCKFYPMIQMKFPDVTFYQPGSNFTATLTFSGLCNWLCDPEVGIKDSNIQSGTMFQLCHRVKLEAEAEVAIAIYSCSNLPVYIINPRGYLSHIQLSFNAQIN